jgi:hypothetical protein
MYIFPLLSVKTGSFVYDVNVGLDNWQPSQVRISVFVYCTYMSTNTHAHTTKYMFLSHHQNA